MIVARTADGRETALLVDASGKLMTGAASGGATSVWSAIDAATNGMTLSNGGLTVNVTAASLHNSWQILRGSTSKSSGKVYVELKTNTSAAAPYHMGVASSGVNINSYLGDSNYSIGMNVFAGAAFVSAGFTSLALPPIGPLNANDVIGIAMDFTTGKGWVSINNIWASLAEERDPVSGTFPNFTFTPATVGALFPAMAFTTSGANGSWTLQSTAASQKYAPPSGFTAWDGGTAPPPTSVWSPTDAAANGMTLSNGGLTVTPSGTVAWQSLRGSIGRQSGKLYVEFLDGAATSGNPAWGLASASFAAGSYLGSSTYSSGIFTNPPTNLVSAGFQSQYASNLAPAAQNDVWALAVDFTTGNVWIARNNVWSNSSNPATGAAPIITTPLLAEVRTAMLFFPAMSFNGAGNGVWTLQSTAAALKYAPPSGFKAWDAP